MQSTWLLRGRGCHFHSDIILAINDRVGDGETIEWVMEKHVYGMSGLAEVRISFLHD